MIPCAKDGGITGSYKGEQFCTDGSSGRGAGDWQLPVRSRTYPTGNDGKCDRVVAGDQNGKVAPAVSARFFAAGDPTS